MSAFGGRSGHLMLRSSPYQALCPLVLVRVLLMNPSRLGIFTYRQRCSRSLACPNHIVQPSRVMYHFLYLKAERLNSRLAHLSVKSGSTCANRLEAEAWHASPSTASRSTRPLPARR